MTARKSRSKTLQLRREGVLGVSSLDPASERIHALQADVKLAGVEILRQNLVATGVFGGGKNLRIPIAELIELVDLEGTTPDPATNSWLRSSRATDCLRSSRLSLAYTTTLVSRKVIGRNACRCRALRGETGSQHRSGPARHFRGTVPPPKASPALRPTT